MNEMNVGLEKVTQHLNIRWRRMQVGDKAFTKGEGYFSGIE